jgi:hypothetical protein
VFGPRRFAFAHIAIIVLSLVIGFACVSNSRVESFSCSPVRPLGSLGFNSQSRRQPRRSPSFVVLQSRFDPSVRSLLIHRASCVLVVCRRVVEPVIPCSTPTSPARFKHDLVVCKSPRNPMNRVKTKQAAWCSPSARQKARTSCAIQV